MGPLRESSSLLEDALPLAYSGNLDMPSVLQLYQAAAGARAAEGGMGKYLLLLPVLNAIDRLQGLLHDSESCLTGSNPSAFMALFATFFPLRNLLISFCTTTVPASQVRTSPHSRLFIAALLYVLPPPPPP